MNVYDTLRGVAVAAQEAATEMRRTDALMHEINGKVMTTNSPHEMRAAWLDVYQEWCPLALNSQLLREREPRMTLADIKAEYRRGTDLRRRAMEIYARWRVLAGHKKTDNMAASVVLGALAEPKNRGETMLKYACIAAALLGGAAAAKVLMDSFKKTPAPTPTPPAPLALSSWASGTGASNGTGGFGGTGAFGGMVMVPVSALPAVMPPLATPAERPYRPMFEHADELEGFED